ncbi:hypothetical protein RUM43_007108 [Polyplax serrata]|uniref:Uncharacterized protein n=1 Tax=Polyplax serrata TaxID=468196 RepID=A0AAN8S8I4_POLSC
MVICLAFALGLVYKIHRSVIFYANVFLEFHPFREGNERHGRGEPPGKEPGQVAHSDLFVFPDPTSEPNPISIFEIFKKEIVG